VRIPGFHFGQAQCEAFSILPARHGLATESAAGADRSRQRRQSQQPVVTVEDVQIQVIAAQAIIGV
jgi:hypothetical protein